MEAEVKKEKVRVGSGGGASIDDNGRGRKWLLNVTRRVEERGLVTSQR